MPPWGLKQTKRRATMLRRKTNFNLDRSTKRARMVSGIPIVALLLAGGMVILTLCPVGIPVRNAQAMNSGVATLLSYLPPSITLTLSDKVEGEIEPRVDGAFSSISTIARVQVNNSDQYSVLISGEPNMTDKTQPSNDAKISSVEVATVGADFRANTWGYNVVEGKNATANETAFYNPVGGADVISTKVLKDTNNADDYYTLSFGAKVDNTLPAGSYSSTVTLSAVASPKVVVGFDETDTMQGLTADICRNVDGDDATHATDIKSTDSLGNNVYTKRLKDVRDGKYYWVTKLADGNCWMTQNLALDITEAGLTPELSDVTEPWNSQSEYPPEATSSGLAEIAGSNYSGTKSWTQGEYVYSTPLESTSCTTDSGVDSLSDCIGGESGKTFVNVDGWTASNDPAFMRKHDNRAVDESSKTYDAHYLVGNWYTLNAATAGTGVSAEAPYTAASDSICPKGWELPTTTAGFNDVSGSFFNLLDKYGVLLTGGGVGSNAEVNNGRTLYENVKDKNVGEILVDFPLSFVRAGDIGPNGKMFWQGNAGYLWGSVYLSKNSGYNFHFNDQWVINSMNTIRSYGFSVRCLVNTDERIN